MGNFALQVLAIRVLLNLLLFLVRIAGLSLGIEMEGAEIIIGDLTSSGNVLSTGPCSGQNNASFEFGFHSIFKFLFGSRPRTGRAGVNDEVPSVPNHSVEGALVQRNQLGSNLAQVTKSGANVGTNTSHVGESGANVRTVSSQVSQTGSSVETNPLQVSESGANVKTGSSQGNRSGANGRIII